MKNYICIDGKKAELTPEQLKALGIEVNGKGVFGRVDKGDRYYYITSQGNVKETFDMVMYEDCTHHDVANYCTDKTLMKQRALYETLNRLLWRYSMEHNGDKIDWFNKDEFKYCIGYSHKAALFTCFVLEERFGAVYFYTKEIAESAIREVVKPFMSEHPEFKL